VGGDGEHLGWATGGAQACRARVVYNQTMNKAFFTIQSEVVSCRVCSRLVEWREEVAVTRRKAFKDQTYWGRPVPAFGDEQGRVLVLGLAPAAHGANRTGRQFTGDSSGDWLFRALHRAGFANQETSVSRDDGLRLDDLLITSPVRCAPPGNKPTPTELSACSDYLARELRVLKNIEVVVALGGIAWKTYLGMVARSGVALPKPRPKFSHAAWVTEGLPHELVGSFHPSRLNTQTGRLTEEMLDQVFQSVRRRLGPSKERVP
jgi:uracil-DNA glycosylase family 4